MPPTIDSYYRSAIKEIEQEVEATADADAALPHREVRNGADRN